MVLAGRLPDSPLAYMLTALLGCSGKRVLLHHGVSQYLRDRIRLGREDR
jgi:hypothetical protein